jgi:hyperosmotically inducible periplasmic protein
MTIFSLTSKCSQTLRCLIIAAIMLTPCVFSGQDAPAGQTPSNPDNSERNKGHKTTADQQSETASDRTITKNIRKALIADKSLSIYGHNVKIITRNGSVTLKGPVHTEDEKQKIVSKAAEVVGDPGKVNNEITVKQ